MRDRLALIAYVGVVLLATTVHDLRLLGVLLLGALLLAGRQGPGLARRALLAVVLFNAVVSLAYVLSAALHDGISWRYVVLLNLRVFLLTFLALLLGARINAFRALDFSPTLLYLLTLAYSQALTLRRAFEDFQHALRSRTLGRLGWRDVLRQRASLGLFLMGKSLHEAGEITQAMKSRGFFDD